MEQFVADLWTWLAAVIWNLVFGVGTVVSFGLIVLEIVKKRPVRWGIALLAVSLLFSSFFAWRNERDAMIVYKQPIAILLEAFVRPDPSINGFEVFAPLVIQNPGDSSIFNWYSESIDVNGKPKYGEPAFTMSPAEIKACGYDLDLSPDDSNTNAGWSARILVVRLSASWKCSVQCPDKRRKKMGFASDQVQGRSQQRIHSSRNKREKSIYYAGAGADTTAPFPALIGKIKPGTNLTLRFRHFGNSLIAMERN